MESAPVSLFIELERGQKADLEVIARASLAFAAAIKEAAFILDPSLTVRVELVSGTEGSLRLNSVIKALKQKTGITERLTIASIAAGVLFWFGHELADYGFHAIMDHLRGQPAITATMSQKQVEQLAVQIAKILQNGVAETEVHAVYRELERDKAVKGVGATSAPDQAPINIVPRSEFSARADHGQLLITTPDKREIVQTERVTLISPVLVPGARKWRFLSRTGEFGASIRDDVFIDRLLGGRIIVPMMGNIEMDVSLKTVEEFQDGVWVIIDRTVLRVLDIHSTGTQTTLRFPFASGRNDDDKDN